MPNFKLYAISMFWMFIYYAPNIFCIISMFSMLKYVMFSIVAVKAFCSITEAGKRRLMSTFDATSPSMSLLRAPKSTWKSNSTSCYKIIYFLLLQSSSVKGGEKFVKGPRRVLFIAICKHSSEPSTTWNRIVRVFHIYHFKLCDTEPSKKNFTIFLHSFSMLKFHHKIFCKDL